MAVDDTYTVSVAIDADAAGAVSGAEEAGDAFDKAAESAEDANERVAESAKASAEEQVQAAQDAADAQASAAEGAAARADEANEARVDSATEADAKISASADGAADDQIAAAARAADEEAAAAARAAEEAAEAYQAQVDAANEAAARIAAVAERTADQQAAAAERAAKVAAAESDAAAQAMADGDDVAYKRAADAAETQATRAEAAWKKAAAAQARAVAAAADVMGDDEQAAADKMVAATTEAAAKARLAWETAAAAATRETEESFAAQDAAAASFGDHLSGLGDHASNVFSKIGNSLAGLGIPFAESFKKMGESIDDADTKGQRFGKTMNSVGKTTLAVGAVGLAAVAAESIHLAGNFQQLTNMLVTSAGTSEKQLGMVRTGILNISVQTATSSTQLAEAMYHISSAGFHGAQGLNVLKAAAEGAREEGADLDTVGHALAGTMNDWHVAGSGATAMMDQMLQTVADGDLRMQDLAASLGNVGPLAAAAALSFAQVGGAIATMTSQNMTAQRATQDLNNLIRGIQAPSSTAISEMQQMGLDSNDLAKNLGKDGLTGTLDTMMQAIAEHMGPSGEVLLDAFKKSQAASSDLKTMLDQMTPSVRKLADQFIQGKISLTNFRKELPTGAGGAQLAEFTALYDKTHAFNDVLKAGGPAAQTFTNALKTMTGGATGMNVAMMLTGKNAGIFQSNVNSIAGAADHAGKNVKDYSVTQHGLNFQLDQAKELANKLAIEFGDYLIPKLEAVMHATISVVEWFERHKAVAEALAAVIGTVLATAIGVTAYNAMRKLALGVQGAYQDMVRLAGAAKDMAGFGQGTKQEVTTTDPYTPPVTETAPTETVTPVVSEAPPDGSAGIGEVEAAQAQETAAVEAGVQTRTAAVEAGTAEQTASYEEGAASYGVAMESIEASTAGADVVEDSNPFLLAITAISIGATLLASHWTEVWDGIKEGLAAAADFIKAHIVIILAALAPITGGLSLMALAGLELYRHWDQIWGDITRLFDDAKSALVGAMRATVGGIEDAGKGIWSFFSSLPGRVMGEVSSLAGSLAQFGTNIVTGLYDAVTSAASAVWAFFTALPGRVIGDVESLVSQIATFGQQVISGLYNAVTQGAGVVWSWFQQLPGNVINDVSGLISQISNFGSNVAGSLYSGIVNNAGNLWAWFENLPGELISDLGNVGSQMASVGESIVEGIVSGIESDAGKIAAAIESIIPSWARGALSKVLGISMGTMERAGLDRAGRVDWDSMRSAAARSHDMASSTAAMNSGTPTALHYRAGDTTINVEGRGRTDQELARLIDAALKTALTAHDKRMLKELMRQ